VTLTTVLDQEQGDVGWVGSCRLFMRTSTEITVARLITPLMPTLRGPIPFGKIVIGNDEDFEILGPVVFAMPDFAILTTNYTDKIYGNRGIDQISAQGGGDEVYGGSDTDFIDGGAGNDLIYGDGMNWYGNGNPILVPMEEQAWDVITAGTGNDTVYGGGGDDWVWGQDGADRIFGENGDDYLDGGAGADNISGGDGNDEIQGGADNDVLNGDAGNDTICAGTGNDLANGGEGDDLIHGGAGNDSLNGGAGNDAIDGGAGADQISGGDDDDVLLGGAGNDRIWGDNGTSGQADGDDYLGGGAGNDTLVGGGGSDRIFGGTGNDRIDPTASNVSGAGDQAADYFIYKEGVLSGDDTIVDFEAGYDKFVLCSQDAEILKVVKITAADLDGDRSNDDARIWLSDGGTITVFNAGVGTFKSQALNTDGLNLNATNAPHFIFVDSETWNNEKDEFGDPIADENLWLCMEPAVEACLPPIDAPQLCWDDMYATA
jgi:Ca2+-binding RTX toxin-like protein